MVLVEDYLDLQEEYEKKFGPKDNRFNASRWIFRVVWISSSSR